MSGLHIIIIIIMGPGCNYTAFVFLLKGFMSIGLYISQVMCGQILLKIGQKRSVSIQRIAYGLRLP